MIYYVYNFCYCHYMLYILICDIRILSFISYVRQKKKHNELIKHFIETHLTIKQSYCLIS
jgi:hypothetical protein